MMGRFTEFKVMIDKKLIPADNDFLMEAPSLGLKDKEEIKRVRANHRKFKLYEIKDAK
jgi:hypothetical protein